MGPRSSCGDQLVTHLTREREVGERVTVEVTELTLTEPELDPAEAMRRRLDSRPPGHRCGNAFPDAVLVHFCERRSSSTGIVRMPAVCCA